MMLAAVTLELGDYAVIAGMLTLVTTVLMFNMRSLTKRVESIEARIVDVEQNKVAHRDWIRVVASQLNRQERMSEQLAELTGKLDATIGVAAHMKRVADAMVKQAEHGYEQ